MPADGHRRPCELNAKRPMPAGQHLLPLLCDTGHAFQMQLADWDSTLRLARQARVLGMLAHRLKANKEHWSRTPERVRSHFEAAINYSAYRAHLVLMELRDLERALPTDIQVTLLKGAAYLLQGLSLTTGRAPNDVDLLIPRDQLDHAEAALKKAGWQMRIQTDYDERYYREWSHELPPLRYPGHPLEVDLHHSIAPVTSRTRANDALLFADRRPIPDSRWRTLSPLDQIIHATIHLFQDSELTGELRGLVDIDALLREHLHTKEDWTALTNRADQHQATRLLWYALHYCRSWLGTPVPENLALRAPAATARRFFDWIFTRACPPYLPDRRATPSQHIAIRAGQIRYHSLRMPPALLIQHLQHKSLHAAQQWLSSHKASTNEQHQD